MGRSVHGAVQAAEALRRRFGDGCGPLPFTVSIGVAARPAHAVTVEGLFAAADAALYEAKDRGRNQVQVAKVAEWRAPSVAVGAN